MSQLPRVGITTSYTNGTQSVSADYGHAVLAAGGIPLILPMVTTPESAHTITDVLDGLIITGGPGITQGLIGTLPPDLEPAEPERTLSDSLIFQAFSARPILGICYGMQFINAQAGGTIYADVHAQMPGALCHSHARGATQHRVTLKPQSHLSHALETQQILANTHHIQAIATVGDGLNATAWGPDGVIEALESADGRRIGVQFHPERMLHDTLPLFKAFVQRCRPPA